MGPTTQQTAEGIGNLAVFYASDKARMITGQVVAVDGGISQVSGEEYLFDMM